MRQTSGLVEPVRYATRPRVIGSDRQSHIAKSLFKFSQEGCGLRNGEIEIKRIPQSPLHRGRRHKLRYPLRSSPTYSINLEPALIPEQPCQYGDGQLVGSSGRLNDPATDLVVRSLVHRVGCCEWSSNSEDDPRQF